jgi:hypothetical protein
MAKRPVAVGGAERGALAVASLDPSLPSVGADAAAGLFRTLLATGEDEAMGYLSADLVASVGGLETFADGVLEVALEGSLAMATACAFLAKACLTQPLPKRAGILPALARAGVAPISVAVSSGRRDVARGMAKTFGVDDALALGLEGEERRINLRLLAEAGLTSVTLPDGLFYPGELWHGWVRGGLGTPSGLTELRFEGRAEFGRGIDLRMEDPLGVVAFGPCTDLRSDGDIRIAAAIPGLPATARIAGRVQNRRWGTGVLLNASGLAPAGTRPVYHLDGVRAASLMLVIPPHGDVIVPQGYAGIGEALTVAVDLKWKVGEPLPTDTATVRVGSDLHLPEGWLTLKADRNSGDTDEIAKGWFPGHSAYFGPRLVPGLVVTLEAPLAVESLRLSGAVDVAGGTLPDGLRVADTLSVKVDKAICPQFRGLGRDTVVGHLDLGVGREGEGAGAESWANHPAAAAVRAESVASLLSRLDPLPADLVVLGDLQVSMALLRGPGWRGTPPPKGA